ncbi:MAG: 5-guanidino-2-oxopentanoate decarboxylase [Halieaceae bacterium]|jgi:acetolactate synthase-1/2/3 large subunit|nr:5-guanidino-2-oxopentanoate decarboxylase [Halieaceae bacterium]
MIAAASCGERLVELLEAYGIDTVFGIPGNHTVALYRGLAGSRIRHISPRHEQGAAFMADGFARACGRPAACFLITGPGLANALTPIMQALADSIPMLVITAVGARSHLGHGEGRLHELPDQQALAAQCTRFSHTLLDPDDLPRVLARAFAVFDGERPGPVHIEIPTDLISAPARPATPWPRVTPPCASPAALDELAGRLLSAQRPTLLLGGGAIDAADALRAVAELSAAAVVTTTNGKGLLPPGHPLLVGGSPSLASVRDELARSDVVLAVGTEFGETDYDMLFLDEPLETGWLARLDIDARQLGRNQIADLPLCGAARESASELKRRLVEKLEHSSVAKDRELAAERVRALREAIAAEVHVHPDMQRFFATVQASLPGLCLVGDSCLPTYYAVWQYEAPAPRCYFHSATGAGTLGYAIPAAIGARRALPSGTPVVALIGDGAAQFTLTELAAAVQESLPIIVIVWNNAGYGEIRNGMRATGLEPLGVEIQAPDFVAAATALGCHGARVKSLEALAEALREARDRAQPTLLELPEASFVASPVGGWYG